MQSTIQPKKWQMLWKKNWTLSLKGTEESVVDQNSFTVLSIVFCILQTVLKQEK